MSLKSVFFLIGMQRSGTSYFCKKLESHPEVTIAKPFFPEPKFFISNDSHGLTKEEYLNQYFPAKLTKCIGEKSTSYIEYPSSAKAILKLFPDAKFLVLLRNPALRAISNYFFSFNNGLEKRNPNEALTISDLSGKSYKGVSVSPFAYLERGHYFDLLYNFSKEINPNRLKIMLYEELISNDEFFTEICSFLGINSVFSLKSVGKINSSVKIDIDPEITDNLMNYYKPLNEKLSREFSIDLSLWN